MKDEEGKGWEIRWDDETEHGTGRCSKEGQEEEKHIKAEVGELDKEKEGGREKKGA